MTDSPLTLAFTPGRWTVELRQGGQAHVFADGFSKEHGEYVFSVLVAGEPDYEFTVARLPGSIVADVWGPDLD